jgi:serine/threonine-protein kinase RsbW
MTESFHLQLPSNTDFLDLIRDFISKLSGYAGFDEENVYKISLAVDEACTNVIRHAYDQGDAQIIDIEAKISNGQFTVIVSDTGKGFNPDEVGEPNLQDFILRHKVGGFGLYLIKTLMDKVDFSIEPGVRNAVQMRKFLEHDKKT